MSNNSQQPRSVLIVEDNQADIELIRDYLAASPGRTMKVLEAQTLASGVDLLERHEPDVLLLDLGLPDTSPDETLIRLETFSNDVPVIVLTGGWSRGLELSALSKGAEEFLDKNHIDGPTLRRRIKHAIKRHEIRNSLLEELEHRALHDRLTGLPNRSLFREQVRMAVERSKRRVEPITIAFLDLDDFKSINDTFGHAAGDELLRRVGRRLDEQFRAEDTVARIGGDEFTGLFECVDSPEDLSTLVDRLTAVFDRPIPLDHEEIHVDGSIGIVHSDDIEIADQETEVLLEAMLRAADRAMYTAKEQPGTSCHQFDQGQDAGFQPIRKVNRIRDGIDHEEFVPYFQPIYDLESDQLIAAELLARWQHPDRGIVFPGDFIPLATKCGLINDLTESLVDQSLHHVDSLSVETGDQRRRFGLSINLSPGQMGRDGELEGLVAKLDDQRPDWLAIEFEVTERGLLEHPETIAQLHNDGFRVAIDDFGTGYSSLKRLKEMPVDTLKIDMAFVQGAVEFEKDAALTELIVELGRNLDLRVVAEGIESEAQLNLLTNLSCEVGQGFHLAKPLPWGELAARLGAEPRLEDCETSLNNAS